MAFKPVLAIRCHYCSRWCKPYEVIPIGTGGAIMCWQCWEWHQQALDALAGKPPRGCQECGATFEALEKQTPGGNVRMYVHPKDGIYQVLCAKCSDRYTRKRLDLYGDTQFGWEKKLKGAK